MEVNDLGLVEDDFGLLDMIDDDVQDDGQEEPPAQPAQPAQPQVQKKDIRNLDVPKKSSSANNQALKKIKELESKIEELTNGQQYIGKNVKEQGNILADSQRKDIDRQINDGFKELYSDPVLNNPDLSAIIDLPSMMPKLKEEFNRHAKDEGRYFEPRELAYQAVVEKLASVLIPMLHEKKMFDTLSGNTGSEVGLKNSKIYSMENRDEFLENALKNL